MVRYVFSYKRKWLKMNDILQHPLLSKQKYANTIYYFSLYYYA